MPRLDQALRKGRGRRAKVRPVPAFSQSLVSWPSGFTYLGAFKVDYAGLAGEHRYGRGLAFHSGRGNLLSTYNIGAQTYGVYEFPPGTPTVGSGYNPAQYDLVEALKDYQRTAYTTTGGADLIGLADLSGDNGLGYDPDADVVPWSYSEGYGSNLGSLGYATLNYAGETATGVGRFMTSSPAGFKGVSGGMVYVPEDYATAYLSGKRWAFWGGRNQSIVALQDLPQGFSLTAVGSFVGQTGRGHRASDLATSGAGQTTITSAAGGFPADIQGQTVVIYQGPTGANFPASTSSFTVVTRNSASSLTLNTSPTLGGAGTGGILHQVGAAQTSTPLVGFWPTTAEPGAGEGRANRPDGETLSLQALDDWGANKWTWIDHVQGCVWINTPSKRGVLFCGRYGRDIASYLSSDVVGSYHSHFVGVYDPQRFAPVTAEDYYDIQADQLTNMQWPVVDYSAYALGALKTVSSITSDSGKTKSSVDGCTVNCTSHGFSNGQSVRISGSNVAEYNLLWKALVINADSFYLQNTTYSDNWSGTSSSNGGIQACLLGSQTFVNTIGLAFDHATGKLYVLQQVEYGAVGPDQLQVVCMVYQLTTEGD